MTRKLKMVLVEDPTGSGRRPGPCRKPDEPLEPAVDRLFLFWFGLVPCEFVGKPNERVKTTQHRLKVVVAANRLLAWKLYNADREKDLTKVAFYIGKTQLEQRLKKRDLHPEECIAVHMDNFDSQCPCDPTALAEPVVGAEFELEVEVERTIRGFAKD